MGWGQREVPGGASPALWGQLLDAWRGPAQGQAVDSQVFHPQHQPHEADRLSTTEQLRKLSSGKRFPGGHAAGLWQSFWLQGSQTGFLLRHWSYLTTFPRSGIVSLLAVTTGLGTHNPAPHQAGLCLLKGHTWPRFQPQTCSGQDHITAGLT